MKNIKAKLWNGDKRFFTALSVEGEHDDVCELHGYAPFYFRMPLAGYEAAREPLGETFAAPAGLSFGAQCRASTRARPRWHECQERPKLAVRDIDRSLPV